MLIFQYFLVLIVVTLLWAQAQDCKVNNGVTNPNPNPDTVSPELYTISMQTNIPDSEPIVIEVVRKWAPLGADRFYSLVQDGFYNTAGFFRVVPDFVAQFGISGLPEETAKWNTAIPDDPVLAKNIMGTVTFATAGPNTRTTQLFINYVDNTSLDAQGFAPFGKVLSGWNTVLAIYNPTPDSSNGVSQAVYTKKGNDWLLQSYPNTTLINCATIIKN